MQEMGLRQLGLCLEVEMLQSEVITALETPGTGLFMVKC